MTSSKEMNGTHGNATAKDSARLFGYARVSTNEQNLDRQLIALAEFGVPAADVFADKASGADFARPKYSELKRKLRAGDVLVVKSIDRLGRNYDEILDEWRDITKAIGADIVVIDMPLLDTRERPDGVTGALIGDIVLQLLSYVAQVEREEIHRRQAEGIAAAQARGVRFGRPRKQLPASYPAVRDAYIAGSICRNDAVASLEVSASTFYRWLRDDDAARVLFS